MFLESKLIAYDRQWTSTKVFWQYQLVTPSVRELCINQIRDLGSFLNDMSQPPYIQFYTGNTFFRRSRVGALLEKRDFRRLFESRT